MSLNISWMASFIGSDSICPVPPVATTNLVLSGWVLLKPAALISLRASSGAYFNTKAGLPNHGLLGSTWPRAGLANPPSNLTMAPRSMARLAALRRRMSVQGVGRRRLDHVDRAREQRRGTTRIFRRADQHQTI